MGSWEETIDSALLTVTCRMSTSLLMNARLIFSLSAGPLGFWAEGGKKKVVGPTQQLC